jgi:pectin methylesterase-like acyl-CoA thioesterase
MVAGLALLMLARADAQSGVTRFPADGARDVNPDTHLVLTFPSPPTIGKTGEIRVYDAADNRLVDTLDLSVPPGPTTGANGPNPPYTATPYEYTAAHATNADTMPGTPSGGAAPTPRDYQLSIIGGFSDGFHFYPVIVHDRVATIALHHNLLQYDRTYYVQIDPGVLTLADGSFKGIGGTSGWRFRTKSRAPARDSARVVVAADGTGDFDTVQGAFDFVPDRNPRRVTIFVRNGSYEEIVYFRNKSNITLLGEDRDKVVVFYANNEVFNPHPSNISTNEWPGTFPSRRAAFMGDNITDIHLVNLTIKTTARGQAEGLLLMGDRNLLSHVTVMGSGDALQVNGPVYITDSLIVGDGDTILGRGPAFFRRCELQSGGVFMWIRNTATNHGNVFVDCTFRKRGAGVTELARAPVNNGRAYPYAEAVLINAKLEGISPAGWGAMGGDTTNMHYWEYNSTNLSDGKPVDVSQRKPESRQLTREKDADTIARYSDPSYVLGWAPAMAPLVLAAPKAVMGADQTMTISVRVAAVPDPTYQWMESGKPIAGATQATLTRTNSKPGDASRYSVRVSNASGTVTSGTAVLTSIATAAF